MNRFEQLKKEYRIVFFLYATCKFERTRKRYFQRLMHLFNQLQQLHRQQQGSTL